MSTPAIFKREVVFFCDDCGMAFDRMTRVNSIGQVVGRTPARCPSCTKRLYNNNRNERNALARLS